MNSDFDEIRDILKQLAVSQKETDARFEKTEIQLAKTIKKLDAIGVQMGDLGHSNGEYAESFFYDTLADKKTLGGIKYDVISKNYKRRRQRTEDEYDIFLENGSVIGIIEVKYKVQEAHIEKLITKKKENFRILFPEFNNYKLYMGIAGLSFEPNVEQMAIDNGLVVLKQKGEILHVNSSHMMAF
jgi:hypothetical protein